MTSETITLEKHDTEAPELIEGELPPTEDTGFFAPERRGIAHGVAGGLTMMAIAVIWFVVGYGMGVIFLYPPILFLIGIYACLKGLVTGMLGSRGCVRGRYPR